MDKMRAIQYFNQAAQSGSFTAAARHLGVSTPAVTQLVAALERSLGITLFHRSRKGLSLTADGERYFEVSRKVAADVHGIEQDLGPRGAKPRGTLTVGMRDVLGHICVLPRLGRFLSRYPEVDLILKPVATLDDVDGKATDVTLLTGWPVERDLVVRPIAQTRLVVCASPDYWRRNGKPEEPEGLSGHDCLVIRSTGGTQLDRWEFERNGERRSVDVRSRLCSDERIWLHDAACAGLGVLRLMDLTAHRYFLSGALVPVLTAWEVVDAPTIFAVYPPSRRQSKVVRVFVDFLVELFAELENERTPVVAGRIARVPKPEWFGRAGGRHSAYVARKRKSQ
jgi:LysR family transcriptional regulator, regulator for bpeEF and oprC